MACRTHHRWASQAPLQVDLWFQRVLRLLRRVLQRALRRELQRVLQQVFRQVLRWVLHRLQQGPVVVAQQDRVQRLLVQLGRVV